MPLRYFFTIVTYPSLIISIAPVLFEFKTAIFNSLFQLSLLLLVQKEEKINFALAGKCILSKVFTLLVNIYVRRTDLDGALMGLRKMNILLPGYYYKAFVIIYLYLENI